MLMRDLKSQAKFSICPLIIERRDQTEVNNAPDANSKALCI